MKCNVELNKSKGALEQRRELLKGGHKFSKKLGQNLGEYEGNENAINSGSTTFDFVGSERHESCACAVRVVDDQKVKGNYKKFRLSPSIRKYVHDDEH